MSDRCWAIILAGGEGTRIQPFIKQSTGLTCPKQYFAFCGRHSMLEHTNERAMALVGADRVVTVIGSGHRRYLRGQKIDGLILEQPTSRGTLAGVLLPAAHILARDPRATIFIFPSDHFISPTAEFVKQVELARLCVEEHPGKMILLAAVPDMPETDYGWIEPGRILFRGMASEPQISEVRSFREKPSSDEARMCFEKGFLWNTMIVVTKVKSLWRLGRKLMPEVIDRFESFSGIRRGNPATFKGGEVPGTIKKLYDSIPAFDFSSTLLTSSPSELAVMPLKGVLWSDWGRPERVLEVLRKIGREPGFLRAGIKSKAALPMAI